MFKVASGWFMKSELCSFECMYATCTMQCQSEEAHRRPLLQQVCSNVGFLSPKHSHPKKYQPYQSSTYVCCHAQVLRYGMMQGAPLLRHASVSSSTQMPAANRMVLGLWSHEWTPIEACNPSQGQSWWRHCSQALCRIDSCREVLEGMGSSPVKCPAGWAKRSSYFLCSEQLAYFPPYLAWQVGKVPLAKNAILHSQSVGETR